MANKKLSLEVLQIYLDSAKDIEDKVGALPIRECMKAWGYSTPSATKYVMDRMVGVGMLRRYPRNKRAIYRTIEEEK